MTNFSREHYLDNLKTIIILLVIFHHSAEAYSGGGGAWPVSDAPVVFGLGIFQSINAAFFMGILFFISGYVMPKTYLKLGGVQFLNSKIRRLLIPFIFIAIFIFIPANYALGNFPNLNEYLTFLPTPDGIHSFTGHLWFIIHLLIYSVAYLTYETISAKMRKSDSKWIMPPKPISTLKFSLFLILFILLLSSAEFFIRIHYGINTWIVFLHAVRAEPAHILQYLSFFILGIITSKQDIPVRISSKSVKIWAAAGLASVIISYLLYFTAPLFSEYVIKQGGGFTSGAFLRSIWENFIAVGFCITLLSFFKKFAGSENCVWNYLNSNSYGIYIIHVFPLVGIQMALVDKQLDSILKFLIASILTAAICCINISIIKKIPGIKYYI